MTGSTSEHHYQSHRDRLVPKAPMTAFSLEVSHSTDGKVGLQQIQLFGPSMSRKHAVPHSEYRDKTLIPFLFSLWLMLLCLKCLIVGRLRFWVWFVVGFSVLGLLIPFSLLKKFLTTNGGKSLSKNMGHFKWDRVETRSSELSVSFLIKAR